METLGNHVQSIRGIILPIVTESNDEKRLSLIGVLEFVDEVAQPQPLNGSPWLSSLMKLE